MNKANPLHQAGVTVVIAGNTYTLRSDDPQTLRDLPAHDRDRLIGLLEALKAQRDKSQRMAQAALTSAGNGVAVRSAVGVEQSRPSGERLGKGDVDAIMARLIAEERQQRKPGLKPATIYKFAAGIIVVIALLSFF